MSVNVSVNGLRFGLLLSSHARSMSDPPSRAPVGLQHEKLDVYAAALDFISLAYAIMGTMPRRSPLADQLERAATSIALNTAEGSGEFSPKEKARFFRMALRSCSECAAILDVGVRMSKISRENAVQGRQLLVRMTAMLTALATRHERA